MVSAAEPIPPGDDEAGRGDDRSPRAAAESEVTQPVRAETTREVPAAVAESPQEEPATTGIRRARRKKSSRRNMVEWAIVVVGAVLIAVVLRSVAIQAFYIPSASMEPTLEIGDRVLVNKLTYRVREPRRGDIVVFERPVAAIGGTVDDLIKRVIGLPGEVIEAHDGRVFVDGEELEEPWLADGTSTPDFAANQVPPGHVFVLGDNRSNSEASNRFGPVDDDLIVGRAFVLIWPLDRIGGL